MLDGGQWDMVANLVQKYMRIPAVSSSSNPRQEQAADP